MFLYNSHPLVRYFQNRWLFASPAPVPPPNPDGGGTGGGRPLYVIDRRNGKVIYR